MTSAWRNTSRNDLDVNILPLLLTTEIILFIFFLSSSIITWKLYYYWYYIYHGLRIRAWSCRPLFISLLPEPITVPEQVLNEFVNEWMTTLGRKHSQWKVGVTLVLVLVASLITLLPCRNYSPSNSETLFAICAKKSDKKNVSGKNEKCSHNPQVNKDLC